MNEIREIPALEGLEALRALAGAARIIHRFIPGDMSFAVIEGDTYIAYVPGRTLNFGRKPGDVLAEGAAGRRCMKEKRPIVKEFGKDESPFGIPYIAHSVRCSTPREMPWAASSLRKTWSGRTPSGKRRKPFGPPPAR
jgi:hypothetical protein